MNGTPHWPYIRKRTLVTLAERITVPELGRPAIRRLRPEESTKLVCYATCC